MKKNLGVFALHPIPYLSPIFKEFNIYQKNNSCLYNLSVFYGNDYSKKSVFNKEFKSYIRQDNDLLDGYRSIFLKNYPLSTKDSFFYRINPTIIWELYNNKIDIILIHGYNTFTSWLTLLISKILNIKVIFRGEVIETKHKPQIIIIKWIKRKLVRIFLNNCNAIMYSCKGNKSFLSARVSLNKKMFFIPCAVDNNFYRKQYQKNIRTSNAFKKKNNIDLNDMVIVFSGRFTERKRPMDILKAVSTIPNRNITLIFLGDGPLMQEMKEFSSTHEIKSIFTGYLNKYEISKYYSISDLFIIPSDYDPSPKALNEAMNFKLPVIVSRGLGTCDDLVDEDKNGYIIDVGDTLTLSKKIDLLNNKRNKLIEFGNYSYNKISSWNFEEDVKSIIQAANYVIKET